MESNVVLEKALAFALRIVRLCRYLNEVKKEFVLAKELLVSGTNIGKYVNAAVGAEARQYFISEFGVAKRRCSETQYWLLVLLHGEFLSPSEYESIEADRVELARIINSILSTSKANV
jgi:four helix bundle protein